MTRQLALEVSTLAETDWFGGLLAAALPAGLTVGLQGTLGAGKTRLVESLAANWGIAREHVVSPTFVLCQHYVGERAIYHLDAYRLNDEDEFLELGVEEFFDAPAVTIVEWAERVADCLPSDRLEIQIEVLAETARRFALTASGPRSEEVLTRIEQQLADGRGR